MPWTDNYLQASYKNIDFHVPSHNLQGGRRVKIWEYPFQNTPYVQSLGNKAKRFSIDGYIIGEDYMNRRNLLIRELDKDENGKLVHPYYGEIIVQVTDYNFREIWQEGRIVRFTLQCVQSGELSFPITKIDALSNTANIKVSAYQAMIEAFEEIYEIANKPHSVASNTLKIIDKSLDVIELSKTVVSAVSDFKKTLESARDRVQSIAYDAIVLSTTISELIQFGTNFTDEFPVTVENSEQNFNNMRTIMDFTPDLIIDNTETSPEVTFINMTQLSASISACTLLTIMQFDSYESAIEFRDIAINKLDSFLETIQNDDLYNILYELRKEVIQDIENRAEQLPRLNEISLPESIPALVLSHNLYQTIDNEDDLIKRNSIINPAFMPAIKPLEVLVYA